MHSSIALVALVAAGSAAAKTIQIDVGKGGLTFSPDTSTADVGDILEFHFYSAFHTAVQGDFNTPCQRGSLASTGFNSGPINNKADGTPNVFQVTVKDTKPIWFYCSTPSHCQSGMAGVVNAPSSGNTLATYKANAAGTSSSEGSSTVSGGQVVPLGTQPSGAPASSSAAPASSAASAASSAASKATSAASSAASVASSAASSAASKATSAASSAASVASSVAGSVASGASSAAAGGSTTAAATNRTTATGSAAASASTSARPSTVTTNGAAGVHGSSVFVAQGTLAALVVGLGFMVYLMA